MKLFFSIYRMIHLRCLRVLVNINGVEYKNDVLQGIAHTEGVSVVREGNWYSGTFSQEYVLPHWHGVLFMAQNHSNNTHECQASVSS